MKTISTPSDSFPQVALVRQSFPAPRIHDVGATVREQMERLELGSRIQPGASVAVPGGSRGISGIALILKEILAALRDAGAAPFVVPAMGSHGGATSDGQMRVLEDLGITEATVGAPIRATMETVVVAETDFGLPIHFDRFAAEADHVFLCNRIKPHTRFVGPLESGLYKMMLIGLGKHAGAAMAHRAILTHSFPEIIRSVGEKVIRTCNVLGGLAILENSLDQTALLEAIPADSLHRREAELLIQARAWLPQLPFPEVDVLVVDRIGKNISGVGMDSNVVGRKFNDHAATSQDHAACRRIVIRSLTPETHGNATGIGMCEYTTQACVDQIDHEATRINCVTGLHPEAAMIPITLPTDREAIATALATIGLIEPPQARLIQIRDTLHLNEVLVSRAFEDALRERSDLERISEWQELRFDSSGRLRDMPESPE